MVLPAPLGPVIAIRSRPWTVSSTSCRSGSPSHPAVTPRSAPTSRPAPAAVELDLQPAGVARLVDVGLGLELAPQPPLARLGLLGHLLRVPLLLVRAEPARGPLRPHGEPARGRDVGFQPPAVLLLRLVGELQPRAAAGLLLAVGGVAALVGVQLAALELEDLGDRLVEEAAVVGDDQHRARELLEERLEPGQAVEVEVVGGLVEQQDRGPGEQHAGQQRTGGLAAAQRAERHVERHVGDAERVARAVELRVQRPAAERPEAVLGVAVRGQRVGLVQALLELRELVVQPPDLAERGAEQAVDRQLRPRRLLRQVPDPVARPERHAAALQAHRRRRARAAATSCPAPLPPTSATRREPDSVRLSESNSVVSPYATRRSDALSSMAAVDYPAVATGHK